MIYVHSLGGHPVLRATHGLVSTVPRFFQALHERVQNIAAALAANGLAAGDRLALLLPNLLITLDLVYACSCSALLQSR